MYTKWNMTASGMQIVVENKKVERRVWPILSKLATLLQTGKPSGEVDGLEYRTVNSVIGTVVKIV